MLRQTLRLRSQLCKFRRIKLGPRHAGERATED
jgi:hypothetical protein